MELWNVNGGGCSPTRIASWIDVQQACPIDPTSIIKYAEIGGSIGVYTLSSNYIDPGGAWAPCTATFGVPPDITALETDNQQMVAEAKQWNFTHLTWNSASALAIPLRRIVYLRGGTKWLNHITINSGGDPIQDVQLSLLFNAGTRGDKQSTVPVIKWTGLGMTDLDLYITFNAFGVVFLGLWFYNGTNYQMFELQAFLQR